MLKIIGRNFAGYAKVLFSWRILIMRKILDKMARSKKPSDAAVTYQVIHLYH
jgi:hypothetical protein